MDVTNKHLEDVREAVVGKADDTIDADNVTISVDEKYHPEIRKMLHKHNKPWSGWLGNVNITQHKSNLIPGALLFKSAPYQAGQKARKREQSEIVKQLKPGVIEHFNSKLTPPVLFARKKVGRLRFCANYRKVNTMKIKHSYPYGKMDEYIYWLGDAKVFTT